MARLPDPGNINRVGFQPSTSIARGSAGGVENALGDAALAKGQQANALAGSVTQLSDTVVKLAHEHQRKLDGLMLDNAANRYRDATVELSVGDAGYRKTLGGDVLKPEYLKKHLDAHDAATRDIANSLNTPAQKAAFKVLEERGRSQFRMGLYEHSAEQSAAYDNTVFNSSIASSQNLAATNAGNSRDVQEAVSSTNDAILKRAKNKGWDATVTQQAVLEATGAVHATVIDSLRQQGRVSEAQAYLNANWADGGVVRKGSSLSDGSVALADVKLPDTRNMTAAQLEAVQSKLKPATEWVQGNQAADAAMSIFTTRDKNGNSDPKADEKALKSIRKAGLTEGATHKAMAAFREQQAAHKQAEENVVGGGMEQFIADGSSHASANAFMKTEEFLALPRDTRGHLAREFDSMAGLADRREEASLAREDKAKGDSEETQIIMGNMMSEPELGKIPVASIWALLPRIGETRVRQIIAEKKSREAGTAAFKLDQKLIDDAMPDALKNSGKPAQKAAYYGIIEGDLLDWKTAHPGQTPNAEDQAKLIRSALATHAEKGMLYGTNDVPRYKASQEYQTWETEIKAAAQQRGRVLTQEQLAKMWSIQLQKSK